MSKTTTKKKAVPYKVTARILGRDFVGKGKTLEDALGNVKAGLVKGKCVLTVEHGKAKKDRILSAPQAYRVFAKVSTMTKEVGIKQISTLFDGV